MGDDRQPLSVDVREIRDLGSSVGVSFDIDALRELGYVDDDGEIEENVPVRQRIDQDGRIELQPLSE